MEESGAMEGARAMEESAAMKVARAMEEALDAEMTMDAEMALDSEMTMQSVEIAPNSVEFVPHSVEVVADSVKEVPDSVVEVPDSVEEVPDSVMEVPDSIDDAPDDEVVHCPHCSMFHAGGVFGEACYQARREARRCARCGLIHSDYDLISSIIYLIDPFDCEIFIPDVDKLEMNGNTILLPEHVQMKLDGNIYNTKKLEDANKEQ